MRKAWRTCRREDHFAPARGKALASPAGTRLNDHRMALRRARHRERPARLEELSRVVKAFHLARIGIAAGLLVDDDGAVVPAIPMPEHHLHEFVGSVVAQVMFEVLVGAHVERFAVVDGGYYVPGRATAAHQIKRGKPAGKIEGLEVGGRASGSQP